MRSDAAAENLTDRICPDILTPLVKQVHGRNRKDGRRLKLGKQRATGKEEKLEQISIVESF